MKVGARKTVLQHEWSQDSEKSVSSEMSHDKSR